MATNTATSFTNHTAPSSGSTAGPYAISFNYLEQSDVDVTVDGVLQTLSVAYTFTSGTQITFTSGNEPANGAAIVIKRNTNISAKKVDFQDGSVLTETDLDTNTEQLLFGLQEFTDKINGIEDLSTRDMDASEIRAAVEAATDSNVFTDADHAKLDSLSNVTNAILNSDLDGKGELLVGDGSGNPTALPVGTDGYVLKADSNEPTGVKWSLATANAPLNQSLNASNLTSGTIPSSVFPATLPAISGTNLTNLNASNLSSGTVPDDRFPATLPAASATNLTSIPAGQLTGALPAIDGSALTNLPSGGTTYSAGSGLILTGTTFSVDTLNQNTTGSAATLTTARNIAGVAFDGSADISLNNNAITNGAGYITDLINDTTPQLGGDLDMNSKFISSGILGVKNTGSQSELRLYCEVSNAHYASIKAPAHADFSGNITYTLPSGYGSNGQVLKSDGSGGTSWVDQPTANATHTGEVTGSTTLTIADDVVDEANLKVSNSPTNGYVLTAQSGNTGGLTWAAAASGLVGSSNEKLFVEAENQMDNSFTTTANFNYVAASPMTIATGAVLTVSANSTMTFI